MTVEDFWLEALLILALILANGFFAASEIAVIAMLKPTPQSGRTSPLARSTSSRPARPRTAVSGAADPRPPGACGRRPA